MVAAPTGKSAQLAPYREFLGRDMYWQLPHAGKSAQLPTENAWGVYWWQLPQVSQHSSLQRMPGACAGGSSHRYVSTASSLQRMPGACTGGNSSVQPNNCMAIVG